MKIQRYMIPIHLSQLRVCEKSDDIRDWCRGKDVAEMEEHTAKLEAENERLWGMLKNVLNCPYCDNVGWGVVEGEDGEPEQAQCEWCYTTPNSKFNLLKALEE